MLRANCGSERTASTTWRTKNDWEIFENSLKLCANESFGSLPPCVVGKRSNADVVEINDVQKGYPGECDVMHNLG